MLKSLLFDRYTVRQHMRYLRRNLTHEQQNEAGIMLAEQAMKFVSIAHAQHITLFLSTDGEIDTFYLIKMLWKTKKQVYLPVLHPFSPGYLLFFRYTPKTLLQLNKFYILEPFLDITQMITLEQIDIILVPMVAFNDQGQRLGMGGGFYDRTLQNWQQYHFLPIGIAHDFQHMTQLPIANWDICLPVILTPSKIWYCY
ncbi:hypothetical protein HHS_01390 [Candidatus Pantoea carbekii]|uniref:5-formyltetrahydrofolate cyclo-ligase n=1 Tax=Candidatus Pantoea carbekii TaxID=1235990 RepID=U3U781_9GAMM|nr:hypothetical protein HHS_01390 [Candidatus Pantoea carbekii]